MRALAPALVAAAALGACRSPALVPAHSQGRGEDADTLGGFDAGLDPERSGIERFHVPLGDSPTRGPADAPITVVMFSDFECPFCQRGHETVLELERRYSGKVRIAYKAYPLDMHSHALLAAMAARSAQDQGRFWEFHDQLFSQRGLDLPRLIAYAREAGLDLERMRSELESLEHAPEVRRDIRLARRLGVDSTPTFFINGRELSGAQPIEAFEEIVEEELELAEGWLRGGVAPEGLYEHAISEGYRKVVYTEGRRGLDPDAVFEVPIGDSPVRGPADAPITIVAFGDFQCPFCVRGSATMEAVRERYADRVRVVYKHFPLSFHSHAFLAARAAEAAKAQGKFWAFHDALYAEGAQFDEDTLRSIAKRIGLDMKAFDKAMTNLELDRAIDRDQRLAATLGVTGTPAFFVNGRPLEGAQPELQFRMLVEEELERAAAAVARGVEPGKLYETLTHEPLAD
jgi:protein-disulfide isomerase